MKKIKTICLNCFGVPLFNKRKIRFELIGHQLAKTNADIINLQEVFDFRDLKILTKYLGDKYNVLYTSKKFFIHSGLVIFIKKEIKYFDYKFKQFDNQGNKTALSFLDGIAGKGYQSITLSIGGQELRFVNCHMLCQYNKSKYLTKSYSHQVSELVSFLKRYDKWLILSGDLNSEPKSSEISRLKKELKLEEKLEIDTHSVDLKNYNRGNIMNIFSNGMSYRTDYTFVSKPIKIIYQKIIFDRLIRYNNIEYHLSDHYGIYSELEI